MSNEPISQPEQRLWSELMEYIEHLREKYGETYQIGDILILTDLIVTEGDTVRNSISWTCSDPRRWVQVGLMREALDLAETLNSAREAQQLESEDEVG